MAFPGREDKEMRKAQFHRGRVPVQRQEERQKPTKKKTKRGCLLGDLIRTEAPPLIAGTGRLRIHVFFPSSRPSLE